MISKDLEINIETGESVKVPEELRQKALRLEQDPQLMLDLVDMIFFGCEDRGLPS